MATKDLQVITEVNTFITKYASRPTRGNSREIYFFEDREKAYKCMLTITFRGKQPRRWVYSYTFGSQTLCKVVYENSDVTELTQRQPHVSLAMLPNVRKLLEAMRP